MQNWIGSSERASGNHKERPNACVPLRGSSRRTQSLRHGGLSSGNRSLVGIYPLAPTARVNTYCMVPLMGVGPSTAAVASSG
jgi:hypothetical protein